MATSGLGYFSCPLCALWKMWHGQRKSWTWVHSQVLLWVLGIILHAHVVQFILCQSKDGGSLYWVTKISLLIIYIVYPVGKQIKFRPQRCPILKGSQYFVWFDWGYIEHKNAVLLSLPCSSFQLFVSCFLGSLSSELTQGLWRFSWEESSSHRTLYLVLVTSSLLG